jgi:nucleotide-binding universal stress UspA family protein
MSGSAPDQPAGRCLVLGYDGSEGARRAAAWAVSDLPPDGHLVLVRAGRPLHMPPSPLSTAEERAEVGRAIFDELMLDGEESLLEVQLSTEVSDEDPVTALLAAAERHHAHAIVLGCEQHSRLRRALGVVTTELLARSPVPVISVPAGAGS